MSLAKYKMDKIIQAVTIKGYSREPSMVHSLAFLWKRFKEELEKIDSFFKQPSLKDVPLIQKFITLETCINHSTEHGYTKINYIVTLEEFNNIKNELADLSNFIGFIFDRILIIEKMVKGFEG